MKVEENSIQKLIGELSNIPIPNWVKKNILTAIGKGLHGIIVSGFDWPTAWLEAKAKEIRAKSDGNKIVQEEASKQVAKLFNTNSELANRALGYYAANIVQSQINREDVVFKFLSEELHKQTIDPSNESEIDEDWLIKFWSIAESKSSNEIKLILSRILAKETVSPNSISPITLQLISTLPSDVGKAFQKLCNMSIRLADNSTFFVHPNISPFMNVGDLDNLGLSFSDQVDLEGIGLIRSMNVVNIKVTSNSQEFLECEYAGLNAKLCFTEGINIINFTRSGCEIRNLLELTPNPLYSDFLIGLGADKFQLVKE